MIIYKTTNLINGKFYVGKDSKNDPFYFGSGALLNVAIKKYGKDNFKKEILEEVSSIEILDIREIYWINELNSADRNIGYNITPGGTGGNTYANNPNYDNIIEKLKKRKHTEETKKKISENNWQKKNIGPMSGIKWSNERRLKHNQHYDYNPGPFANKNHSDETKERIRKSKIGSKHSDETKQKMSDIRKGMKYTNTTCPICGKEGSGGAMKRWHFNNCKEK